MNVKDIEKYKKRDKGILAIKILPETEITFFSHKEMIVGVAINTTNQKFWNNRKEVLLDAVYNGYKYRMGLDKFKSERSLVLRINNFVKYIINDNVKEIK